MRGHRLELLEIEAVMKQEAIGSLRLLRLDVWELDVGSGNHGKLEAIWIAGMRGKSGIFWNMAFWMDPFSAFPRIGQ